MDDKARTIQLIRTLWPDVRISEANVTPDVTLYVYSVFVAAKQGHSAVKALGAFVGPVTSWKAIPIKLAQAVYKYTDKEQDWGLAIRGGVAAHRHHIQSAMTYGTDTYPLQFR
jgi:hypothetical protein